MSKKKNDNLKMTLTVGNRFDFQRFYKSEASLLEHAIQDAIKDKVDIKSEDIEKYDIKESKVGNQVFLQWNTEKEKLNPNLEVEFNRKESDFLKERVKFLDENKLIPTSMVKLCNDILSHE